MKVYNETEAKIILGLKNALASINNEFKEKGMFSIEYLLINQPVSSVMNLLKESNKTFYYLCKEYNLYDFFNHYCDYVKRYYDSIMIKEGNTDDIADTYFAKLKEPTNRIYPKSNIDFEQSEVEKTLKLMKEAIKAYYDVYHNKELIAELRKDDSKYVEYLDFAIKEQELLHLLGVTSSQLKNNPDFIRLTGRKNMRCDEIIEWIMRDIDGNNDLLQYSEDFLKSITQSKGFQIIDDQYSPETTTQLLNYGKIRSKSQTFLKYGPLEKVSLVSQLNKPLSKYSKSNYAMISKADTFRKYPWAYFGQVRNNGNNYIETLQIDSHRGKETLLKGSRPAIVTGVHIIGTSDGSGTGGNGFVQFSEEEQLKLISEAYESFSDWLEFDGLISYFNKINGKTDTYSERRSR